MAAKILSAAVFQYLSAKILLAVIFQYLSAVIFIGYNTVRENTVGFNIFG